MAGSLLTAIFGERPKPAREPIRLTAARRPELIYAVGDVHGCLDQLLALEAQIVADAAGTRGEKWIVMLGDYIDRGPASAQVLDHLLAPAPSGFRRICLRGNHEQTLLDCLGDASMIERWLEFGGVETMLSYGMPASRVDALRRGRASARQQMLAAHIPDEHLALLRELPSILAVPGYVFVHAGLRPGTAVANQVDSDMLWIRRDFLDADHDFGAVVVHGHTPVKEPFMSDRRVGIDTGCYMTGRLTAARVDGDGVRVVD